VCFFSLSSTLMAQHFFKACVKIESFVDRLKLHFPCCIARGESPPHMCARWIAGMNWSVHNPSIIFHFLWRFWLGPAGQHGPGGGRRSAVFNLPVPEGERLQESCQRAGKTRNSGKKLPLIPSDFVQLVWFGSAWGVYFKVTFNESSDFIAVWRSEMRF